MRGLCPWLQGHRALGPEGPAWLCREPLRLPGKHHRPSDDKPQLLPSANAVPHAHVRFGRGRSSEIQVVVRVLPVLWLIYDAALNESHIFMALDPIFISTFVCYAHPLITGGLIQHGGAESLSPSLQSHVLLITEDKCESPQSSYDILTRLPSEEGPR